MVLCSSWRWPPGGWKAYSGANYSGLVRENRYSVHYANILDKNCFSIYVCEKLTENCRSTNNTKKDLAGLYRYLNNLPKRMKLLIEISHLVLEYQFGFSKLIMKLNESKYILIFIYMDSRYILYGFTKDSNWIVQKKSKWNSFETAKIEY